MTTEEFIKRAQVYYYTRESEFIGCEAAETIFNIIDNDIKILCLEQKIQNSDLWFFEFTYLENNNLNLLKHYFHILISLGDQLHKSWFNKAKLETQFLWYTILKKDYENCEEMEDFEEHWITNWYNTEYKVKWRDKQIDSILKDE